MIEDLRRLEAGSELDADLCVVGAGAAGIALAQEFLGARTNVVVLESGGLRQSAETESLNEGSATGLGPSSLIDSRGRLLGGATALWAGQCLPPDRLTFERRDWIPHSGWPFDQRTLEPFLRRAEALLGIPGAVYDERVWGSFGVSGPSIDAHLLLHRFSVWCPEPHLGRLYRKRLAASANVRVLLNATATEILTTPTGERLAAIRADTPEGKSVRVRARACVMCGGAIENCRLMLASNGVHPSGIGNAHDLVGRFFQEHPNGHVAVVAPEDPGRLQELYGLMYRGRTRYLPRLVLSPDLQRDQELLACSAIPVFHFGEASGIEAARRVYRAARSRRRPTRLRRELGLMARDVPRLASAGYRRMVQGRSVQLKPAHITLQTFVEQAPNPESRVTLSSRRDQLGVPLPHVDWRLSEIDRRTARAMIRTVGSEFGRLGLGEVLEEPWLAEAGWQARLSDSYHHMGTTRMGTNPNTSVVDPDCQVHGLTGLFVAGSSVFPAAGYANPTLTIVALAIRLGDHLKGLLCSLPRPESAAAAGHDVRG
jgi:choline dehydrogenase-like flavoprotein